MLSKVLSASLLGIEALPVEVEVDISTRGLPHFTVVGLPDASVKESRDRVKAALKNIGLSFPVRPITINLAPADLKKEGALFDLPMAVGLLASEGVVPKGEALARTMFAGELSLDGRIKPVRGALSMALLARREGLRLMIPLENAPEAAVVEGAEVYGVSSLPEVVDYLRGDSQPVRHEADLGGLLARAMMHEEDFSEVMGQEHAKRALEVAAAGGHNVLMIGPPGSGKTMLSSRLPTILPPITFEEAIETTRIHSVAGVVGQGESLVVGRPFRAPHHTISDVALIGGGQHPKPGEVSLAHNGVLFLDELPEFKSGALNVLRQPLESGSVTVSRAAATVSFPARFMLVGAMNPCPCGYFGDSAHQCTCTGAQINRYRSKVSGPMLDRFDIHIEVPAVEYKKLTRRQDAEPSREIARRVVTARDIQLERFRGQGIFSNSAMKARHIRKHCSTDSAAMDLLEAAMKRLHLSARAYTRVLKLARTIADLDGAELISSHHVSEAIQYRSLDRPS